MTLAFSLTVLNLFLIYFGLKSAIKWKSPHIFFWMFCGFFFILPFSLDVFGIFALDQLSTFSSFIDQTHIRRDIRIEYIDFEAAAIISLSTNMAYFIGQNLMKAPIKNYTEIGLSYPKYLLFVLALFNIAFIIIFLSFNEKPLFQASIGEAQSTVSTYAGFIIVVLSGFAPIALLRRQYIVLAILALGPIFLTAATSQRPWAVAGIGSFIFFYFARARIENLAAFLVKITLLGAMALVFLRAARALGSGKSFDLTTFLLERDPSYVSMIFVFANADSFEGMTGGGAFQHLFLTGWYPEFLFGEIDFSKINVIGLLAWHEMGWITGSVHPTLYAWAFVDLGYWAFLLGFFLSFSIGLAVWLVPRLSARLVFPLVPAISVYIASAARGTVQAGWARFVFLLAVIIAVSILIQFLRPIRKPHHSRPKQPSLPPRQAEAPSGD